MARKKASQLVEQAESRRRFAEAAARAKEAEATSGEKNQVRTLVGTCEAIMKAYDPPPSSPVALAERYLNWDMLYIQPGGNIELVEDIERKSGVKVPHREIDLLQATMELEDAPMDSLSPQLQQLKLGFEQIPLDPNKPAGMQRRINEALRAAGEELGIRTYTSDWKIDRSTIPPTRSLKTEKEKKEGCAEQVKLIRDLFKRNRKLHDAIRVIMAEDADSTPTSGLEEPWTMPDGSKSLKVQLVNHPLALGYYYKP